jgi:hypothetical protein
MHSVLVLNYRLPKIFSSSIRELAVKAVSKSNYEKKEKVMCMRIEHEPPAWKTNLSLYAITELL